MVRSLVMELVSTGSEGMSHQQGVNMESSIIERIQALQAAAPRLVIAIDGRGGAGKSSLARKVVAAVAGAVHVEFDWFHLPKADLRDEARFDAPRLIDEVLKPFRQGRRDLECHRYNWGYLSGAPDGLVNEPIRLHGVEGIVLEGCGVLSPELAPLYNLRIWLDTPAEEALERGMRRDIEEYGLDPERVKAAWEEWAQWEARALAHDNRSLRSDIRLTLST